MPKALVLSSGGVDSTTCLGLAVHELGAANVVSVSMFYGQKHKKELEAARKLAEYYNVQHYELDLSVVFAQSNCSLLSHSTQEVPEGDYADQIDRSENGMVSTLGIEDGSYLRLNTLTLGYTLPSTSRFAKALAISSLRVYATAYNVFTLTKYSGLDPEVSTNNNMNANYPTPGIDYGAYPRARSFVLGLNVAF